MTAANKEKKTSKGGGLWGHQLILKGRNKNGKKRPESVWGACDGSASLIQVRGGCSRLAGEIRSKVDIAVNDKY